MGLVEILTLEKMSVVARCLNNEHFVMKSALFEKRQGAVGMALSLTPDYSIANHSVSHMGRIMLRHKSRFQCTVCGRETKKLFDACCFPCFQNSAQADRCLLNPVKCHYAAGTCREPDWGEENCYQAHYVYLAFTDKLKVGITRATQVPTRWIDQGATSAVLLAKVGSRHQAGLLEAYLSSRFADKSHWLKMLKTGNNKMNSSEFEQARQEALSLMRSGLADSNTAPQLTAAAVRSRPDAARVEFLDDALLVNLDYPLWSGLPEKITSMNLDKFPQIESRILGVKGQYLILEEGVLNVRRHEGYVVDFELRD